MISRTTLYKAMAMFFAVLCTPASAYQPLITDDTGTQGRGGNQIEVSFNEDRIDALGVVSTARVLPLTYTRGLTDTLDFSLSANHTRLSSSLPPGDVTSGSGNPSLGLKWRLYENDASKTSFALKAELGLPISQDHERLGLGSGRGSTTVTGIFMQETSFGAILVNLVGSQVRFSDTLANPDVDVWRASIAPVWQVNDQWKLALDMGRTTELAAGETRNTDFFEVGAVYSPDRDLDLALGLISRKDPSSASNTGFTLGVTWRFR